jgi:hypothetical protein
MKVYSLNLRVQCHFYSLQMNIFFNLGPSNKNDNNPLLSSKSISIMTNFIVKKMFWVKDDGNF